MSRHGRRILLAAVIVFAAVMAKSLTWSEPVIPPSPQPNTGLACLRQGGDAAYCRCLDSLESARSRAGLPGPDLPRFDDPAMRQLLRDPKRYPMINGDSVRCVVPRPAPQGPTDVADGGRPLA